MAMAERDTVLRKASNTNGGEYCGGCPFCGGRDRFRLQPLHDGGVWYCRGCGGDRWHDAIDYMMFRDNLDFKGAVNALAPGGSITSMVRKPMEDIPQEEDSVVDRVQWTAAAGQFLEDSQELLFGSQGKPAMDYLVSRGLDPDTIRQFDIGYNLEEGWGDPSEWGLAPGEKIYIPRGIVIGCQEQSGLHYLKIRRSKGDPKYLYLKGSQIWPYGLWTTIGVSTAMLFESELDCALAYATGFIGVAYCSLPAGQSIIKPEYDQFFENIDEIIVALDCDGPGKKAAERYRGLEGFILANDLPNLCKDLGEYYKVAGIDAVFEWLYTQVGLIGGDHEII